MFFLLSAFLITELLGREQIKTGTINLKAFYFRRILRIWPLYFMVLYGLVAIAYFLPDIAPTKLSAWLAFTFFSGNWYICNHGWLNLPFNPLWSLSVEEQFYIVIPLIALYGGRRGLRIISLVLIAVSYVSILLYALHPAAGFSSQWTNSFVQFQFFSAGTLLSLYLAGRLPRWNILVRSAMASTAVCCWLLSDFYFGVEADSPHATPFGSMLGWSLILVGTILLFLSIFGSSGKTWPKPLVYLGKISYGLYLFHAFILSLVFRTFANQVTQLSGAIGLSSWRDGIGTVIALAVTIILAMLSYETYERHFLRLKQRFTVIQARD